jgi:hypothetical protein
LFAASMFGFGWSANFNYVHWIVPTLFGVFLAASILLIFTSMLNYLTDTYLRFAASALAANTVARSLAGAAAPLFTRQMFTNLGVGPGASIVGGVACLLAPIPFIFIKYGGPIRERSKFAPTPTGAKPDDSADKEASSESSQDDSPSSTPPNGNLELQRSRSAGTQTGGTQPVRQKKYWQDESSTIAQQIRDMQAGVPYEATIVRTRTGGSTQGLQKVRTGGSLRSPAVAPTSPVSPAGSNTGLRTKRSVQLLVPSEVVKEEDSDLSTKETHESDGSSRTAIEGMQQHKTHAEE